MTKAKSDYIFLGLLGASLVATIAITILTDYELTNYHYAAMAGWLIAFTLRIFMPHIGRYATGILLLLGLFNGLNFFLVRTIFPFSIDPYLFLVIIVYYRINKHVINRMLANIFHGSEKEQADKRQKLIDFYLSQFGNSTPDALDRAFSKINDYPAEAQIALQKIRAGK